MGYIKILDTGFIRPTNAGTQASSANRANGGSAITLKAAEFTPSLSRNISAQPKLGSNTPSEVNIGSLENMQFSLRCILNTKIQSDMETAAYLLDCVKTNGYKLLWYDYDNATTEANNGQLIYQVARNSTFGHELTAGEISQFTIDNTFNHLHVLIVDIQPQHSGGSGFITYTMKGIVLPVETSII